MDCKLRNNQTCKTNRW